MSRTQPPGRHSLLSPERALWTHLGAGLLAAAGAAVADIASAAIRPGVTVPATSFVTGALHIVAMFLPIGALLGIGFGLVEELLRRAEWAAVIRRWLTGFAPNREVFAQVLGAAGALGLVTVMMQHAALHFSTRYHDPVLASYALAGTALVVIAVGGLVFLGLRPIARVTGRALGRLASPAAAMLIIAGAGIGVVAFILVSFPSILQAYSRWRVGIVIGVIAGYPLLRSLLGVRRFGKGNRRWALAGLVLTTLAIIVSGALYGRSNRVRAVVEQRASFGQLLVRRYAALTDRDRDGFSFAFGGRDCDDTRADVYPGAPDPEGDGIDADCFDGDGTREVASFGDGHYGSRPEGLPARPNFLLVTIDALRPDHLGHAGYARPVSPKIDAFAQDAVVFRNVIAQSSRSLRSIPAMMTGKYPSQIAFGGEYLWPTLKAENHTLAESLTQAGYRCFVTMGTDYFLRINDFFQGFTGVNQIPIYKPPRARPVTDAIRQLTELKRQGRPWMLWVHLFNVHQPYLSDGRASEFGDELVDQYDTEIQLADAEFQRLLDALKDQGVNDQTVVILASDHGEAFQEHGHFGHSTTLYGEELRSTLVVKVPGVEPREVNQRVGLLDLMPTVLNLANIPLPEPVPARSLVPLMTGAGSLPDDRLLFSELLPDGMFPFDIKALYRGDHKLMYWVRDGRFELFDLKADADEQHDLSDDDMERGDELLSTMLAWMSQTSRPEQRTIEVIRANRLRAFPSTMIPLDMQYSEGFRIAGYAIESRAVHPGERIRITLFYDVQNETTKDLQIFLYPVGPPGYVIPPHFHGNHFPLDGRYRTFQWQAGEKLQDKLEIVVPQRIQHPATLKLELLVMEGQRRVPFRQRGGAIAQVAPLGEVEIRRR